MLESRILIFCLRFAHFLFLIYFPRCVEYNQVSWYRNASRTLATQNNGRAISALAFFHIPLYEHLDLWNVRGVQGDLAEGEGVCCSSVNTGLYAAMKELGDIKGVYCGK